ncbi:MAG: rhomboid family intramembrane serine protease [Bacteroidia bacterium]
MVTISLIAACVIFSLMAFNNRDIFIRFLYSPYACFHRKQYYRMFTHAFLHGDYMHLAFNMFALYIFGPILEDEAFPVLFGERSTLNYILLYIGGIFASSLFEFFRQKDNPNYSSVGASGAVNAIVFSAILIHPTMGMGLMFLPVFIPAWLFGILFLAYSWYMAKRGIDNVGHTAHFFGAIFGFLFTLALKPELFGYFISQVFGK